MSDKSKKQSNYEILGLPENADKTLVEKKYISLVREYRDKTNEYGTTNDDLKYYNKITKAYNDIMGISGDYSDTDPMSIIPYSIRKKFSKISYFLESYKMIICGVILFSVIIILTALQISDSNKEDISIKFVGSFSSGYAQSEDGYIDAQIAQKSEIVDNPIVSYFTVIDGVTTLLDSVAKDSAIQFRSEFVTGELDVIIIDKENLDIYVEQLAFLKLDDFIEKHKNDTGFQNLDLYEYESKDKNNGIDSGIYAIEISDMSFFDGMNLIKNYPEERQTMYLAIGRKTKRPEIAEAFAAEIISTNKSLNP